ncbi:hypothetical protein EDD85DRAFT_782998 [Armillaria nabsnona]|nr:hypothetical protein EDD85DRAFT_782998 [Armillaria nabsnona]
MLSALRLPHWDAAGCTMCAGCRTLCQHKEPLASCANCHSWGYCSCRLSADDLQEAAHPFVEMHDHNFTAANHQICHLLNALHEAYEMRTTALCNLLQVFSSVEGGHDTDAMVKFACKYPVGYRLMIDMGLITDNDGLLQKAFDLQFRHYYPRPLQLHSKMEPEPSLPAFMVIKDKKKKKKKKQQRSDASKMEVDCVDKEEQAEDDQVKGSLFFSQCDLQTLVPDSELE